MPRWHIKPPYPHDTHRGALWCCSTLAFFTYGTKCILHSCGLTDSGSYYAEIWKQLFVLGSWFWSWCAALQPNPDISLHSIPLWKQLSAAQWLHPPLPRAEAAHSVSQAHISHSEMNWLFSSVCRTPHVQARPWNNVFFPEINHCHFMAVDIFSSGDLGTCPWMWRRDGPGTKTHQCSENKELSCLPECQPHF